MRPGSLHTVSIEKDAILRLFSEKATRPLTLPEVEAFLSVSEEEKPQLQPLLDELVRSGQLVALRGQRYGIPQRMNLITGTLQAHPNGYAFLAPDKPGERAADVFIGRNDLADAMHGDKVVVRLERTTRMGRPEGRVVRVLERRVSKIVGEYQEGSGFGYVVPEEGRHLHHIYIPKGRHKRALAGQIVVAEIRQYPSGNRDPEGEIVRILGNRNDPDVEQEVIIERYGLSSRFPNEVLTEAKLAPQQVDPADLALRVDLRGLKTVTIDGENAKDFDDAISISRGSDGRYRLWVSIADVAHYVQPNTALDREAKARGTSVYFTDRVIPMLPEELSNGLCSLNPHVERLTMTAEVEFDSEGKVLNSQFYDSVIVSKERLTYTAVKKMLVDRDEDLLGRYRYLEEDLRLMEELALKLKSRREERGSLDFDLPQPDILLDLEGNIESIARAERNIAHRMIEEFMLAANEAVANFLTKEGVPTLYRCHDEPDPAKLEDLRYFLHNLNLKLDHKVTPKSLQRLLRQVQGKPLEKLVNEVTLRTMKHAFYTPRNVGHFGLASENYLHFTSPIRRYPDLVVHRILKSVLERGGMSERQRDTLKNGLGDIAAGSSEREKNAERAEREALALKKVQFMQKFVGEEFDGYISGVTSFGFFVELRELYIDGLVHVSSLGDDYYEYREREHELRGVGAGRSFRLADKVRVKVARVDVEKRHIDFALVADALREPLTLQTVPQRSGRPVPQVSLEPVHPETGNGRGRARRQQQPLSNKVPARGPRPEDLPEDDRRNRRKERERTRPQREERREVQREIQQRPPVEEIVNLEALPPANPDSPTVPPPAVTEVADNIPATLEGEETAEQLEQSERRRRRRRGGRGRRRRGTERAADGSIIETDGDGDTEGDDENEAPSPVESGEVAAPAEAPAGEGETAAVEKAAAPAPRGRREPREPRTPRSQAPAERAPEETPKAATAEAQEAPEGLDEGEEGEGEDTSAEGELAFVAKRRRRRRGGRGRRRPSDRAGNGEAHEGESAGEDSPAQAEAPKAPVPGDGENS
jgi:ribonuclease R